MNRRYRASDYERVVETLATRVPGCALGADTIVGFPGETDGQFGDTCELVSRLPLTYLHVFTYSEREGTPATRLDGKVPRHVANLRSLQLREIGSRKRAEFHRAHEGRTVDVLLEASRDPDHGDLRGLTDNYIRVRVPGADDGMVNEIVSVRIGSTDERGACGVLPQGCDGGALQHLTNTTRSGA